MAVAICLGLLYAGLIPKPVQDPIQIIVQPDQSETVGSGELCVTLKNRSNTDLVFHSYDLPWEFNGGGIDFVVYREDGSVVRKTPMIADPIVQIPTVIKRGKELSHRMSLLVYYLELPKELALHDLKVNWTYLPRPANLALTNVLNGEFLLKKLTPSKLQTFPLGSHLNN